MKTIVISTAALIAAMTLASPVAFAQDRTIAGVPVPDALLDAVQEKCDELLADQQATAMKQPDVKTPAADAPAAGASDDVAVTESAAETPVDETAVADTAETEGGNMADDTPTDVEIDLMTLTAQLCEDGGFAKPTM